MNLGKQWYVICFITLNSKCTKLYHLVNYWWCPLTWSASNTLHGTSLKPANSLAWVTMNGLEKYMFFSFRLLSKACWKNGQRQLLSLFSATLLLRERLWAQRPKNSERLRLWGILMVLIQTKLLCEKLEFYKIL